MKTKFFVTEEEFMYTRVANYSECGSWRTALGSVVKPKSTLVTDAHRTSTA